MEKLTLNIDFKSCELLDMVLNAFGDGEHLDRSAILEIFDSNENEAVKQINILAQLRFIRKIAEVEDSRLGLIFYKEQNTDLFLAQGGFTAQYLKTAEEKKVSDKRQGLADENARLENEALKHQVTIRDQENRIRSLDEKLKRFEILKNYEWLIRLAFSAVAAFLTWWLTKNI
ncbi:hypothetical protein G7092_13910 [Mucilaginibacter sp. HC2]|uniref:hypothetical protein n=1 Tax=Mucilaginibacter inviolabilis TaxID=2714892 RepID=UPI00140AE1E2|nr:hypothetical protein [Mucilaginibacter inviolabilis]NHA04902.1 hypothetical protein [Mucilaginibacter inviolabilis]